MDRPTVRCVPTRSRLRDLRRATGPRSAVRMRCVRAGSGTDEAGVEEAGVAEKDTTDRRTGDTDRDGTPT